MVCPPYPFPMTSERLITAFTALTPRRLRLGPRADAEFIGVLAIRHRTAAAAANRQQTSDIAWTRRPLCSWVVVPRLAQRADTRLRTRYLCHPEERLVLSVGLAQFERSGGSVDGPSNRDQPD